MASEVLNQPILFSVLEGKFCIAKLPVGSEVPSLSGEFWTVVQAADELSIVCEESMAPEGAEVERNWRRCGSRGRWSSPSKACW